MFNISFVKAAAERAAKTFAQSALALLTGDHFGILNVNWGDVLSVSALAAVVSVLTSVVSTPFGPTGSPSLVEDPAATDVPSSSNDMTGGGL